MNAHVSPLVDASQVESTRYALIRRLGFVFRHHLVVNLQPLNMVCQVLHHRLGATTLDAPALRDGVDQISRLVRTSIDSCAEVVSWIAADPRSTMAFGVGVNECLANVRSSFSFRGFTMHYDESSLATAVRQVAVREVLTAALLATTDHANGLDELLVTMAPVVGGVDIAIQMRRGANVSCAEQDAYRLIEWDDVRALAAFHDVRFSRHGDDTVALHFSQSQEAPAT